MTHCTDFFRKWKREPNFCGVGSSTAKNIDRYINFVEDFSKEYGIEESIVHRNAPMGAIKPILKFKPDSDLRKQATKKIAQTLNSKQAISEKYVLTIIGASVPEPKKFIPSPIAATAELAQDALKSNTIKDKIRLLNSVLTTGQLKILNDVMTKHELDNEYEAIALVIKWAGEKIKG